MTAKDVIPKIENKDLAPTRTEGWNPFLALRSEMDTLFDNFFRGFAIEPFTMASGAFQPRINVADGEKDINISIELPGMDEKDMEISLAKDSITVKGEKKEEKEEKGKNFHRMERSYGSFSRTIPLPVEIDQNKVEATYKQGVLNIVLPKTEKAVKETKKISIKTK